MSAAQFVGRVGGIAAALGVGVAIISGTAVAAADSDGADSSSAGAHRASSAPAARSAAKAGDSKPAASVSSSARGRTVNADVAADLAVSPPDLKIPAVDSTPAVNESAPVTVASPAAAVPVVPAAATAVTLPAATAAAPAATAEVTALPPGGPSPTDAIVTQYGRLGQWMINKEGQVADWVGIPYCGAGSSVGSCTVPPGKIMQEPINTVFVVKASNPYSAALNLDFALKVSGFGPSCCSSIGYQAILGDQTDPQYPRGGPLGLGILPPLPFGLFQTGLLGLTGLGPAYRDFPFFLANTHLRTFGGLPDGKGNYIFTASVSKENLDASGGGLLPTHGYESFDEARAKLTRNMLNAGWLIGSQNLGMIDMKNKISADNPNYTTGDADGFAQVIALTGLFGGLFGGSPANSVPALASVRPARAATAV